MKDFFGDAYNGFMKMVDKFANSESAITEKKKEEKPALVSVKPNYEYPSDNYIDGPLNNIATKKILKGIASKFYGKQIDEIISGDDKLTRKSFPRLWNNFEHCCKTLGIADYPDTYITNKLTGINGLSIEVNGQKLMLLSFQSAILLKDAEQRFLIGHELGHIQQDHLVAHTVQGLLDDLHKKSDLWGPIVNDFLDVPLNRWYRTSEFTADRAGFLCCQDYESISYLLNSLKLDIPVNAYSQFKELSEAHPKVSVRLKKIKEYSLLGDFRQYKC